MNSAKTIQPFKINIPQAILDDLHARLAHTRWPDAVAGAGWSMGTNLDYLKELVAYWQSQYDWRKHEAKLNAFPHFKADVAGVNLHFIHAKGQGKQPTPLLLTHGWPDSFYRFHKIIPMLTNPQQYGGKAQDAFTVVVPSVPGFAFSERTALPASAVADLWANLMSELGYERFAAAGGDIGSGVTLALARQYPHRLSGIHLTDVGYPTGQEENLSETEQEFAQFIQGWWFREGAYAMLQATKPQSIAFGLNDSPVGLAAWILSMVATGAGAETLDNGVEKAFGGRDELLTNIMLYWVTETAGSAARMYLAEAQAVWGGAATSNERNDVPAAFALFPREAPTPRDWVRRHANLQRYTQMPQGGHFAALEEPELFVRELRAFFAEGRP
jgi:pimeloyl-ACP methyl ester carboxylesterase